jgi:hypothetical protein
MPDSRPKLVFKPLGVEVDPDKVDQEVLKEAVRWSGINSLAAHLFAFGCLAAGVMLTLAGFVSGSKIVAQSAQGSINVDGPVGLGFLALGTLALLLGQFSFKAVKK